jgi:VWFA-related protein
MRRGLVLFVALVGLVAGRPAGQAPQVTFQTGVDLVDVEVSVLDRNRLPVRGLTASDFTVLEEGRSRPIVAFSPVDLPPRVMPDAPWMERVAADTHSNRFAREGRLIVILMDRTIAPAEFPEARRIAEQAVSQLREGDMAAVAWSLYGVPQNFTADRQRLLEVIRDPVVNLPAGDERTGECDCGRCSMESIAHIAESLEDISWRRKLLLFIGSRLPARGGGGCAAANEPARRRALRAAEAGNLTIHAIDPGGIRTLSSAAASRTMRAAFMGAEARRVGSLLAFTEPTGGRFVHRNQPSEVLPEIFRESAAYYVLGFEPADARADGEYRRITVRVNRKDVILQTRRGYYAPGRTPERPPVFGPDASPALASAIAGLWPRTDLPVTVGAAPVAVPGVRGGAVTVVVNVRHEARPSGPTRASVLVGAFDHNGRAVATDRRTVVVEARPVGTSFEYEIASRLQVRPGRYEVRAAVEDESARRTGSAYTYIDVPDFTTALVSLSGMFIQAGAAGAAVPGATLADLVPVTPTVRRRFSSQEPVTAFVRAYQSAAREFVPGYAVVEITDATDTRVYRQQQRILPTEAGHRPIDFELQVPVERLQRGPHLLTFEIRHGNDTATREVRFDIE